MTRLVLRFIAAAFVALIIAVACGHRVQEPTPPVAKIEPHYDTVHGREMIDNYHWLRERDHPDVLAYIEAENAYADSVMMHTTELQQELYDEMVGRIKETDLSVPGKKDDYYYYSRTEEGKQYSIYCRKLGSLEAAEEILLDVNELAEGREFASLGIFVVSPDHKLLAYGMDFTGSERYTVRIKNLETGEIYPDQIDSVAYSFAWANDNLTFFYTVFDAAWRPYRVYRHQLGQKAAADIIVFEEKDPGFYIGLDRSRSGEYILLGIGSQTSHEYHYLRADNPTGRFTIIQPRTPKLEYSVDHHGDRFYLVTNDNAVNFKLMSTPVTRPARANWTDVIAHRDSVLLENVSCFADFMAIYERAEGLRRIRIMDFASGDIHTIRMPEPVYAAYGSDNPEYETDRLRFTYTSMVTPRTVYDYHVADRTLELKKQDEIGGGFTSEDYITERIWAEAPDGARIPVSMVYHRTTTDKLPAPLYLYGYGSYGITMDPYFSSSRLSLLDRGFIFAIPHVRGSDAMGRTWYDDGRLLNKKNTFTDFIACAEHLIQRGFTTSDQLVIGGGSAGGLLVGAVVNMRPDLFRIAIAEVPFVDIINTIMDSTMPLSVIEYDEWGNPYDKEYFDYMYSYSPYDNVKAQHYPHMLAMTGYNDTRVMYWEPAKWVARLRALKTDNNRLLLKVNMAGHGGASGRYDALREQAFEYAFVLDVFNMRR
jgi:oligopeptidase B